MQRGRHILCQKLLTHFCKPYNRTSYKDLSLHLVKAKASILIVFYFLSVTGYGVEVHYCLGRVSDINYAFLETSCPCDVAHAGERSGCCEEKAFFIQVDEDHQTTSLPDVKFYPLLSSELASIAKLTSVKDAEAVFFSDRGPPLKRDFQTLYCAFQFYG